MGEIAKRPSSPTRPKASHQGGSRTEGRPQKWGVRSRGEARTQAASLNPEIRIVVDQRISPGNRTESRHYPVHGRQQSWPRQGERAGHHRGLRAGHVNTRVNRELGRASRLLGNKSRSKGDRHNQHPGVCWTTRPADDPTSAQAERDTKQDVINPRYRKGAKSGPTGKDEGSRSNAQYRWSEGNPGPYAWGTEAQGTHDKSRQAAERQCRV